MLYGLPSYIVAAAAAAAAGDLEKQEVLYFS
jgi:hypothetical protein